MRVGPEPTTDRFTAILWERRQGHTWCRLVLRRIVRLRVSSPFGKQLYRAEGAELDSPVLRNITIVDTPGNSVGSKNRGAGITITKRS
jgi:EH domain-containing protein 1